MIKIIFPVARMENIRLMIVMATQNNWKIHQMDMNLTFLNDSLEEVYIKLPSNFVKKSYEEKFYRLKKTLYSFKQAPRA